MLVDCVRLSPRQLNRTLLHRQHLLERTDATPHEMARHLVGLQAQENLPPYLSLAARLTSFDPYDVTAGLEDRSLVRFLTMRGTVHLLVADDALMLRQWTALGARARDQDQPEHRPRPRGGPRGLPRRALGAPRRRTAAAEGARCGAGRTVPRRAGHPARAAGPVGRAAGAVPAARHLEGQRRRGLPVRRPVARPAAGRARRGGDRPALPARVRPGHGRRRHRLVGHHPARAGGQGDGRPGHPRGRAGQAALRRAGARARRRGRPGAGPAARPVRQRLALARRPGPGDDPGDAEALDGRERRDGQHRLRRRHAGRPVAGHRRPRRGPLTPSGPSPSRSSPSSTTRSPG